MDGLGGCSALAVHRSLTAGELTHSQWLHHLVYKPAPVRLVPYDPAWPDLFSAEASRGIVWESHRATLSPEGTMIEAVEEATLASRGGAGVVTRLGRHRKGIPYDKSNG